MGDEMQICFAVIPEPSYEYILADISGLMNVLLLTEALEKASAAYAEFK